MSPIVSPRRPMATPPSRPGRRPAQPPVDHDLPVLAMEQDPPHRPEWESLLEAGVQPALVLGAERRTRGRRQPR
jgi:hypothetical protein